MAQTDYHVPASLVKAAAASTCDGSCSLSERHSCMDAATKGGHRIVFLSDAAAVARQAVTSALSRLVRAQLLDGEPTTCRRANLVLACIAGERPLGMQALLGTPQLPSPEQQNPIFVLAERRAAPDAVWDMRTVCVVQLTVDECMHPFDSRHPFCLYAEWFNDSALNVLFEPFPTGSEMACSREHSNLEADAGVVAASASARLCSCWH
jgi:hypothetical protein